MKRVFRACRSVCFGIILLGTFSQGAASQDNPGQAAYKKMKEAERLARTDVDQAAAGYLQAAKLYEKALAEDPDNGAFRNNYKHCLGTRGFISIKRAQELARKSDFEGAARQYRAATEAYQVALKKFPGDSGFKANWKHAVENGATAEFEAALAAKGTAPDFSLLSFRGRKVALSDFKGKTVLLVVWAAWCPTCRDTILALKSLNDELRGQPFAIVTISMDKTADWGKSGSVKKAEELAAKVDFDVLWGDDEVNLKLGNPGSVPVIVLIDADGNLAMRAPYDAVTSKRIVADVRALMKR